MTQIALYEAKAHLSALVERACAGEEIVITRRGKAMVRLVPADDDSTVEAATAHLLAARLASSPGPQSLRDLIDEGRR